MQRNEIYDKVRAVIDFKYEVNSAACREQSEVPRCLFQLHTYYNELSLCLPNRLDDATKAIQLDSLVCLVLCMLENGIVMRGPGPVIERALKRNKTPLKLVFAVIDGERDYQDQLLSNRTDGSKKDIYGYMVMYSKYLKDAVEAWTMNAGCLHALDVMRKLAGILVHCFEDCYEDLN